MARLTFEQEVEAVLRDHVAQTRPLVEQRVREERATYERDHPESRVCLFCHKRHQRPRLVIERTREGIDRRRWASDACIRRRLGLKDTDPIGMVVQVFR